MDYNTGNLDKYNTGNPLKRKMIDKLNAKILKFIGEFVSELGDDFTILDAGCGEGFISRLIHETYPHIKITGVEYTQEALAIARDSVSCEEIEFVQGDITQLEYSDDSFDVVVCTEVLEHLNDPYKAIEELTRVAKNGIVITVPAEPWFCMGNLLVLKNVSRLGNPIDHVNHWTFNGFVKMITQRVDDCDISFQKSFPWSMTRIVFKDGEPGE